MTASTPLRLNGSLLARLTEAGSAIVRLPTGRPLVLSREELGFLMAFGSTGTTPEEAATRAPVTHANPTLADSLVQLGLLESVEGNSAGGHLARRQLSQRLFGKHARAWAEYSYDASRGDYFTFNRLERTLAWIADLAANGATALDLGCGAGHLVLELARRGLEVHGVDRSQSMIELCHQRIDPDVATLPGRVSLECSDCVGYRSAEKKDFVIALGLAAWLDAAAAVFEAARASTCMGGYFILDCANRLVAPEGPTWIFETDTHRDSIRDLVAASQSPSGDRHDREFAALQTCAEEYVAAGTTLQSFLNGGAECQRQVQEKPDAPLDERRFAPSEVVALGRSSGFELVTIAGVGEVRTLWNYVFPNQIAHELNRPLAALRHLPISALWSTGFLTLFRLARP